MDEALQKRLDAIVALLAINAVLLAGVVVAVGGGDLLAVLVFAGAVLSLLACVGFPDLDDLSLGLERQTR